MSTSTADDQAIKDITSPEYYLNRHLSLLQFNIRVLEQVLDEEHPLLERLRFLSIFSSNLDEFFEIRVADLRQEINFDRSHNSADGLRPQDVLDQISADCHNAVDHQYQLFNDLLIPALEKENIRFLRRNKWTPEQSEWISNYFRRQVMPVISPIGLDQAHPFPRLVNKSLNFIVELEGKDAFGRDSGLAVVPAPRSLPRLIRVPDKLCAQGGDNFVFLSSIIHAHAEQLFPGMEAKGCYQFRITRDADLEVNADEIKDMARALRGELPSRRFGTAVRLELVAECPPAIADFLLQEFELSESELYRVDGPVNLQRMVGLLELVNRPDLLYPPYIPGLPTNLQNCKNWFDAINREDILLHHPYESFTPVVDLVRQAARDPEVLAIKQTLYRTGSSSSVVDALVEAARNGKEVTAVVELRARFDEEDNLELAARLQEAGAVVVYGVIGYKCHAKMLLIVRRQGKQLKRFVHLGTGNYHSTNAKIYTDYSLFTNRADICNDVHKIFQQLTGMGKTVRIKKLFHAPFTLKRQLINLIAQEATFAAEGKPAKIMARVNGLTDPDVIQALYKASQAGVKIHLVVRGMCCLRPGIAGLSDNIRVRSVIGRFLEHARVYYFHNNETSVYCSSADWMERNLNSRVEVAFPVEEEQLKSRITKELESMFQDNCQSWELAADGSYQAVRGGRGKQIPVQTRLLQSLASTLIGLSN